MNKKDTNAGEAVQVIDNKIVGRIERGGEDSSELVPGNLHTCTCTFMICVYYM